MGLRFDAQHKQEKEEEEEEMNGEEGGREKRQEEGEVKHGLIQGHILVLGWIPLEFWEATGALLFPASDLVASLGVVPAFIA